MRHALAMLSFVVLQQGLRAQSAPTPGQNVRITSIHYRIRNQTGTVLAATPDSIVVQMSGVGTMRTDTLALPLTAIDRLEIRVLGRHAQKRWARIGAALGIAGGLVVGLASYQECHAGFLEYKKCILSSRATNGVVGALGGGALGAAVGALAGRASRREKWVEMSTNRTVVSVRKLVAGGLGVGFEVSF